MATVLKLKCDAQCGAETQTEPIFRTFKGLTTNKNCGIGVYTLPHIMDLVPKGWIYPDPYTGCTYCPSCWAKIDGPQTEATTEPKGTPNV